MRAIQEQVGKDKFAVLLISVDLDYGMTRDEATSDARRAMRVNGVDWPCVLEPSGWTGVGEKFGIDGYHVFLVGRDGRVADADVGPWNLQEATRKALGP